MRLSSAFGLGAVDLGSEQKPSETDVRRARVARARQHQRFTEIPAGRLVARFRFWLVDAETDEAFVPYRGGVFHTGTASILADQAYLHFYVDEAGEPRFVERLPQTWSELYARKARREARR